MEGYRVNLLGTFQCMYNGSALDKLPKGKLQLLFVYLLLHMDNPIDRRQLAYLFWPESTDHQAFTNLRKLLHHLKKMLPSADEYLLVEDGQIIWKSVKGCRVDSLEFSKLANQKQIADFIRAESIYKGNLLPGVHADWLIQPRETLFLQYTDLVHKLVHACQQKREYAQAIHYANKLLQYDPLAENAHQLLIRLHLLNNNRTAALRQYHKMSADLRNQLGVQPSKESKELYAQMMKPNFDPATLSIHQSGLFVGRYQEWASLQKHWENLVDSRSCIVQIAGEKGMGKTHLLEQFSHWVGVQGATVRLAKCYPSKEHIPYGAVIQWLEGATVSGLAASYLSELVRIIPSLLDRYPDVPQPEKIDDHWKLLYFYEAIEEALGWCAESLVLLMDDGQWVDEETSSFLEYMLRPERKKPLLIVYTMRTMAQAPYKAVRTFNFEAINHNQINDIRLSPFTETDTKQLVDLLHLVDDEWDIRQVYAVSGGNPLYIQELLLHTGQRQDTARADATLRELLVRRLSSLPAVYRKVTDGLAVIGSAVSLPVLMHVCSMSDKAMQETVEVLFQLRFLKQSERGRVDFFHDTIREAALSMISPAHKTLLHAKIAEAMNKYKQEGMFSAAEIALHYDQAGNQGMAAPNYLKAAERAHAMYEHDQTIEYVERLLEILPIEKLNIPLTWLAHAYRMKGNLERAEAYYRQFMELSSGTASIEEAAMIRVQLATCIRQKGNYHEALTLLETAKHQLEWLQDQAGLIEVYRQMTTTHIHLGQFVQAERYLKRSRGDQSDHKEECIYLGLKADLLYEKARYEEALIYYQQQIQLANRADARFSLVGALFGLTLTYLETDKYAHAFESIQECIRFMRSIGNQIGLGLAIGILGKVYLRAGWEEKAIPCLRYGLEQARQSGDERSSAIMMGLLGHALHIQAYKEEGLSILRQAMKLSMKLQFPLFYGNSLYYLGYAYFSRKEWAKAQAILNEALQIMERDERNDLLCKVRLIRLECEVETGKIEVAKAIKQLQMWLSEYPLHKDQMAMHFTLWKWLEPDAARKEVARCVAEMYDTMPIPAYQRLLTEMLIRPQVEIIDHPPLPQEISAMVE